QALDLLLDAVGLDARRAVVHVVLQPGPGGLVTFAVEHQPDVGEYGRAVHLHVGVALDTHCLTSWRSPRWKPRSRATSASRPLSCFRPRCSRDITVPMGVPMMSAISLYGKPSTSA